MTSDIFALPGLSCPLPIAQQAGHEELVLAQDDQQLVDRPALLEHLIKVGVLAALTHCRKVPGHSPAEARQDMLEDGEGDLPQSKWQTITSHSIQAS